MRTLSKMAMATLVAAAAVVGFSPGAAALSWDDFQQDPSDEFDYCTKVNGYRYCIGGNADQCDIWISTPYAAACAQNVTA